MSQELFPSTASHHYVERWVSQAHASLINMWERISEGPLNFWKKILKVLLSSIVVNKHTEELSQANRNLGSFCLKSWAFILKNKDVYLWSIS